MAETTNHVVGTTVNMAVPPVTTPGFRWSYLSEIFRLSYRNLFRNRRRSIFAITIAASGFASLGLAIGYYSFSIYSLQEMTIRNGFSGSSGSGHAQLYDVRSGKEQEQNTLDFGINDVSKVTHLIRTDQDVDYVMPRIEFGGLISKGDKSLPFKGYGIEPSEEAGLRSGLSKIDPALRVGEQISQLKKGKVAIILGRTLANSLNAKVGDVLMLYGTTVDGAVNGIDVELLGIMSTGVNETDKYYLLTNTDVVQKLVNSKKVSTISIMFKNRENLNKKIENVSDILKQHVNNQRFKLVDWQNDAEFYVSIRDIFNIIFIFMGLIILVIVLLSCWNIMNMTTMERIKEIGTLRAIGLGINKITAVFVFEALLLGLAGICIGFVVQLLISYLVNSLRILMPPIPGMNQGYTLQVYGVTVYHSVVAIGIVMAITLSSMSSFLIIRKISIVKSLDYA